VTEGHTLLLHDGGDKRTKEVFVVSLQRMNGCTRRGSARDMDDLDGGSSAQGMAQR